MTSLTNEATLGLHRVDERPAREVLVSYQMDQAALHNSVATAKPQIPQDPFDFSTITIRQFPRLHFEDL